jgi:hypothetical protein
MTKREEQALFAPGGCSGKNVPLDYLKYGIDPIMIVFIS